MKSARIEIARSTCHRTAEAVAADNIHSCFVTDPSGSPNRNRNVPPERDVEPAMLSLAELCVSIQLPWRAMQPHNGMRNSARTPHVR